MRLTRDTLGTFDQARDPLQRDLVTLQRAFDNLQAQLTAAKARLSATEEQLVIPGPIIAPNGRVTVFKNRDGAPVQPTGGGGVIVAPNGALLGHGTLEDPLAVSVDGVAISINTSNQLQGIVKKYEETNPASTYFGINTTPRQLVAGVASKYIVPLIISFASKSVGSLGHTGGLTNGNTSWNLRIGSASAAGNMTFVTGSNNLGLGNGAGVGVSQKAFMTQFPYFNTTNVTVAMAAAGLYLYTGADISDPGATASSTLTISLLYYEMDMSSMF